VLRRVEFALNEASGTDDLLKLEMEASLYLEASEAGKNGSAEAVQFGACMKNTIAECSRIRHEMVELLEE